MWQLTQLMRIKSVRHNISFYITEYPWILVPEHFIKVLWGQETQYLILKTECFFSFWLFEVEFLCVVKNI